jgi:hypothetical protein
VKEVECQLNKQEGGLNQQDPPEDSPVNGEQTRHYIDRAEQEQEPVQGDTQENKEATATQAQEEASPVKGEQTGRRFS